MTGPEPLHREELLELAALEAYGLLDEFESALFNRAFHRASVSTQEEAMKFQERLAADTSLLPGDEPPADLRERVLAAVSEAIEHETPGPIASIGRRSGAALSGAASDAAPDGRMKLAASGQFWRAASFILAAISLVLTYVFSISVQQHHELSKLALEHNTGAQIEELIGPTFKDFLFDQSAVTVVFASHDPDSSSRAVLLISEEHQGTAFLVTERMPTLDHNQLLTLTVRDANGRSHTLAEFASKDGLSGLHVAMNNVAIGPNMTWEISGPDGVIMRA